MGQQHTEDNEKSGESAVVTPSCRCNTRHREWCRDNMARFSSPQGVGWPRIHSSGNVYVTDYSNNRIRKITSAGVVTTLAGSSQGEANGTGASATFDGLQGIARVGFDFHLYVADTASHTIRKIEYK